MKWPSFQTQRNIFSKIIFLWDGKMTSLPILNGTTMPVIIIMVGTCEFTCEFCNIMGDNSHITVNMLIKWAIERRNAYMQLQVQKETSKWKNEQFITKLSDILCNGALVAFVNMVAIILTLLHERSDRAWRLGIDTRNMCEEQSKHGNFSIQVTASSAWIKSIHILSGLQCDMWNIRLDS